ncbi:thrombospondin type 3 repeat-containing protein, partial [Ostreibacterium oceani]|uniref:thrombospondin type 3 repeat-containing protein n=1 Tax=Ostreibacterium oceani TaxID=2654998 RepID=UPI001C406680
DGDGISDDAEVANGSDPANACDPMQAPGYTGYDASNTTWAAADCDGDGTPNGDEVTNGSDPYLVEDSDGDGIPDYIENAATNIGDGNNDGTPDYLQSNVASMHDATGSSYVTVEITGECSQLNTVKVVTDTDIGQTDGNKTYPYGSVAITLNCLTPGESAGMRVYWHGLQDPSDYVFRKFAPTAPGLMDHQYLDYPHTATVEMIDGNNVARYDYTLTDGAFGDHTIVDSVIIDPAGPSIEANNVGNAPFNIPSTNIWALLVLGLAFMWQVSRHPQLKKIKIK